MCARRTDVTYRCREAQDGGGGEPWKELLSAAERGSEVVRAGGEIAMEETSFELVFLMTGQSGG